MLRTIYLGLFCLSPGIVLAQAPPPALTADDAVALAIKNNPRLSAAAREVAAARSGVRSARALANPNITFTPAITSGGSDEELLLQQPLELNGSRSARAGVARAQLVRTRAEAVVELRNLVYETRTAYYELARGQELRSLTQDVLQTSEELHRGVRRQAEEGLRPGIDPVQTEIEVSRARQQLTLAGSQVVTAQAALNTLMGRPPADPVTALPLSPAPAVGEARPESSPAAPVDRKAALRNALAARAEIAAEAALRDQFRQESRLARAQGRPDLVPQFRAGGVTRGLEDTGVGIGITLPFLDYGGRRHRIRQADASARAQEARITAAQNQVRQEVEQSIVRLLASDAVVRDYQGGVLGQARRLLEASLRALQVGAPGASLLTALEAQRTYRSVLTDYTNALAAAAQARAELERATGAVPADLLREPETARRPERRSNSGVSR